MRMATKITILWLCCALLLSPMLSGLALCQHTAGCDCHGIIPSRRHVKNLFSRHGHGAPFENENGLLLFLRKYPLCFMACEVVCCSVCLPLV